MKISHKDVSSPSIEITPKKISRDIKFIRWIFQILFRKSNWFLIIFSPWKLCNTSIPYSCATFFWLHNYKELRCCTTIRFRLIVVQCCCTTVRLILETMIYFSKICSSEKYLPWFLMQLLSCLLVLSVVVRNFAWPKSALKVLKHNLT